MEKENVNHPEHYNKGGIEALDVILAYDLDFLIGNTLKYILRAKFKNKELEDLKKAKFYLDKKIEELEWATKKRKENILS